MIFLRSLAVALFLVRVAQAQSSLETQTVAPRLESEAETTQAHGDEKPVRFIFDYKSDVISQLRGGIERGATALGSLNLGAELDLHALLRAPHGLIAHLEGLAVYGRLPSDKVGDLQGTDSISAPHSTKVYQAWLQQNVFDDQLSLLAGLHDLNTEFYLTDSSGPFLNTSFAIGPELSRSGRAGPSIWTTTALGARVKGRPAELVQVSAAVYDGVPGDPDHPDRTSVILRDDEGVLAISEVALLPKINGLAGKFSVGAWAYNRELDDLSEVDENGIPLKARSAGLYFLADQKLYAPRPGAETGLSGFLRLGWANADASQIEYSAQSGLLYTGLIPRRDQDQLGLGVAAARAGQHYRSAMLAKGQELGLFETTLELTYRLRLASWLALQPDFQWINNPAMNPAIADAFVGAGRLELMF